MTTPDYDLIRKWDAALRSGAYRQMKGALKAKLKAADDFCYCCMGVLCEVYGLDGEIGELDAKLIGDPGNSEGTLDAVFYDSDGSSTCVNDATMLPRCVATKLYSDKTPYDEDDEGNIDLGLRVPEHIKDEYPDSLSCRCSSGETILLATELNDDVGLTFEQIADCVRYTWPEAFESKA